MKVDIDLTIVTPTFNRIKTLPRLYGSIIKQPMCNRIEWLVVDDGSADDTESLISEYIKDGIINIRYIKKRNGGKHTALNVGIKEALGEYWLCVDSDDFLEENALENIFNFTVKRRPDGIIGYKREFHSNEIIGDKFPEGIENITLFDLINNKKCSGDRTLIYKTKLIKSIQIPEPLGMKFFPETYLYDRFDEQYVCSLLDKSLCCCEYLEEGYSADFRNLMIRNSFSMKCFYAERIDFPCSLKYRFQSAYRYVAYSLLSKQKEGAYRGKDWWLILGAYPLGVAMYIVYEYYRRKK